MIIGSSVMSGIYLVTLARERVKICEELLIFCNLLKTDISTRRTPLDVLISEFADNPSLCDVSFIKSDFYKDGDICSCVLKGDDNKRICDFLSNLGSFDVQAQLDEIDFFSSYIEERKKEYEYVCKSKSRLYFTLCLSVGCVVSLMLI